MKSKLTVVLILSLFSFSIDLWAQNIIQLNDKADNISIGRYLEILEDRDKNYSISQITQKPLSDKFIKSHVKIPNMGLTKSAYWVRFYIQNSLTDKNDWLLMLGFPYLDTVSLFYKKKSSQWESNSIGDKMPFFKRKYKYHTLVFDLPDSTNQVKTIYMRFEMQGAMILPISIIKKTTFIELDHDQQFVYGIYYGLLIVIFFYNLFLFLTLKDSNYLIYIIYITATGVFMMMDNGLGFEYLWPDHPEFNNIAPIIFDFNLAFWMVLFFRKFLNLSNIAKKLDLILTGFMVISFLGLFLPLYIEIGQALQLAWLVAFIGLILVLYASIISNLKKYRPAKYVLIACFMNIIGIIALLLRNAGILPSNFFTIHSMQIGSALELILLSMALGDRYNLIREENQKFQAELNLNKLQALQNRMSPHFLFNTLNTIYSMLEVGYPGAKDAVLKLARTYRFLTDNSIKKLIKLSDEIDFLRDYLEIMQIRFEERVKVTFNQDGVFDKVFIPPLTIQPLVENCFKHGLDNPKINKMDIDIYIKQQNDGAKISITDSGVGVEMNATNGRTLENIRQRLLHNYSDVNLNIKKASSKGTIIDLQFANKKE